MVLYFKSNVVTPAYNIYMGEDKHENEELLKWAFPEDVWFHVDKLSSAHVYLRLKPGETLDDIPEAVLTDCLQLVKANSIQGNKSNNIDIVYTMFDNLKKTASMDVGQVGFHKQKEVRKAHVEKRINEIVNRLNKTKEDLKPDLRALREERDQKEREKAKEQERMRRKAEREAAALKEEEAERRSYNSLMKTENMMTNQDANEDSDDFM
ncbi:hypothetical protein EB796_007547 [Bugula neritina]|uniref:Coiled-coil domain-containing protein 25 n=1 Tax=Bugula neritina TaxID=10212 RepID=A0A7J7K6B5_BUGNE|nr:hypothetical protein EB796_007547 [Bugula neritina]